jgi:hypothetical protein
VDTLVEIKEEDEEKDKEFFLEIRLMSLSRSTTVTGRTREEIEKSEKGTEE